MPGEFSDFFNHLFVRRQTPAPITQEAAWQMPDPKALDTHLMNRILEERRLELAALSERTRQDLDVLKSQLVDIHSEVARHHRDFAKVSVLCDEAMAMNANPDINDHEARVALESHLKLIRNIVG